MSRNPKSNYRTYLYGAFAVVLIASGIRIGLFLADDGSNSSPLENTGRDAAELEKIRQIPKPQPEEPLDTATPLQEKPSEFVAQLDALDGLNDDDSDIYTDLKIVSHLFTEAGTVFKSLPTGTHREIVAFMLGDNPRRIQYFPPEDPNLNEDGEIVDRWGTPFFFHVVSKHHIEVRSAGPDLLHWSEDDVVENQAPTIVSAETL